jgi:short-subunit dehydrogenase
MTRKSGEAVKKGQVVVIVGASSGIGRATALAFAKAGARIVLAARRENVLAALAEECGSIGGSASYLATDVTDPNAVQRLAAHAIDQFGGIDVWINNAGAGVMGVYEKIPVDVHAQVIRVSLLGHMHGAYAVLPHFKEKGKGILINTISIGAFVPEVYGVAYTASKYGLRGFSEALKAELSSWPGIKICDVHPSYIDTPGFQHAANYTGKKLRPVPPVYSAEKVAQVMVSLVSSPKSEVIVGASGYVMKATHAMCPSLTRNGLKAMMDNYFSRAKPAAITDGALYEPMGIGVETSGGWKTKKENNLVHAAAGALAAGLVASIYFIAKRKQFS